MEAQRVTGSSDEFENKIALMLVMVAQHFPHMIFPLICLVHGQTEAVTFLVALR